MAVAETLAAAEERIKKNAENVYYIFAEGRAEKSY